MFFKLENGIKGKYKSTFMIIALLPTPEKTFETFLDAMIIQVILFELDLSSSASLQV